MGRLRNSVHGGVGGHARGMAGTSAVGSSVRGGRGGHVAAGIRGTGDEILICGHCGYDFTFSVEDQAFHQQQNYAHKPETCKVCKAKRSRGTQHQQGGGQSSKKDRDKAAHRGDNKTRNTVKKDIQKAGRKKRESLRGNQGKGRQLDPKGKPGNKSKKAKASKNS
jgi:hypothetical protein